MSRCFCFVNVSLSLFSYWRLFLETVTLLRAELALRARGVNRCFVTVNRSIAKAAFDFERVASGFVNAAP
jgi:hypothetical protein